MNKLKVIFIVLALHSCSMSYKYKMPNMVGGEDYIDITDLITKKGYKPIYCGEKKEICSLINPNPLSLDNNYETSLKTSLKEFLNESKIFFDTSYIDKISIIKHSTYQYSYFITYNLVDVYKTEITFNNDTLIAYFRKDDNGLILPFKAEGWVIQ